MSTDQPPVDALTRRDPPAGSLSHPHLFDFLPALVGLGVARLAVVSPQRGFEQTLLEPVVTESIRVGTAVRGGRFLRGGLRFRLGQSQILLRFAPGEPLLGRLIRDGRLAAQAFQLGAGLSLGRGHAPRTVLLVLGSF